MVSEHTIDHTNNSTNVRFNVPPLVRQICAALSRTSPELASRIAMKIFSHPHKTGPRRQNELNWLADATPFRLPVLGRELAAWSWGDGPTILLHHGWAGRGSQLGAFVKPLVTAGFSVVAYDAPAHGDSPGRTTNGFEMGAIIVEATRRMFGLHGIIAHSLGCSSSAFAMRSGIQVSRLVFLNPPAEMDTYAAVFGTSLGFSDGVIEMMKTGFTKECEVHWDDFRPTRLVRGIKVPLLVVSDKDDKQAPWQHGQSIAAACPTARFVATEGLGHSRILVDAWVIEQVIEFLTEQWYDTPPIRSHTDRVMTT